VRLFRQPALERGDAGDVGSVGTLTDPADHDAVDVLGVELGAFDELADDVRHQVFGRKIHQALGEMANCRAKSETEDDLFVASVHGSLRVPAARFFVNPLLESGANRVPFDVQKSGAGP
jgi:hypothetical protein